MNGGSLLWPPFRLRGIELRNRFVMLAHWNGLEAPDGTPSEDLAAYYAARARGGPTLVGQRPLPKARLETHRPEQAAAARP